MTLWPFQERTIWRAIDGPKYHLQALCSNPLCNKKATEAHHIASRALLGITSEWVTNELVVVRNLCGLCQTCHNNVSEGKSWISYKDDRFYFDDVPFREEAIPALDLEEGKKCPTCKRRKPYEKKGSTPKSKVFTYRVPVDDIQIHEEILGAVADKLETRELPYWKWATIMKAGVVVLQVP